MRYECSDTITKLLLGKYNKKLKAKIQLIKLSPVPFSKMKTYPP